VTTVAPVGAGTPDPLDLDAEAQLQQNEDARLQLVRARAEKWIGAIGALTGVLATALVIKGPDDATRLAVGWRVAAAVALGVAISLLAFATYRAYRAAFGQPDALSEIRTIPLTGLHNRLRKARKATADDALRDLGDAMQAVFAAIALIAGAVAITWFAPTDTAAKPTGTLCIYAGGELVARLSATSIAVNTTAAGTTIRPCP